MKNVYLLIMLFLSLCIYVLTIGFIVIFCYCYCVFRDALNSLQNNPDLIQRVKEFSQGKPELTKVSRVTYSLGRPLRYDQKNWTQGQTIAMGQKGQCPLVQSFAHFAPVAPHW